MLRDSLPDTWGSHLNGCWNVNRDPSGFYSRCPPALVPALGGAQPLCPAPLALVGAEGLPRRVVSQPWGGTALPTPTPPGLRPLPSSGVWVWSGFYPQRAVVLFPLPNSVLLLTPGGTSRFLGSISPFTRGISRKLL